MRLSKVLAHEGNRRIELFPTMLLEPVSNDCSFSEIHGGLASPTVRSEKEVHAGVRCFITSKEVLELGLRGSDCFEVQALDRTYAEPLGVAMGEH